jgi:type II secretory pathway pseudopilin PulG
MVAAKTARIGNLKFKRISKKYYAFTIIESLVATALMLIVFTVFLQVLFICQNLVIRTELYIQNLYRSQFLYWLFYNQITENIGVMHIQEFIEHADNDLIATFSKKLINLDMVDRVSIIHNHQVNNFKISNIKNRLDTASDVIKIKIYNDSELNQHENIYYVAKINEQSQSKALYQYSENRSEELIRGLNCMQVKKITKNNLDYYVFKFKFTDPPETFSFVLQASRLM